MEAVYNFVLHVFQTMPPPLAACLIGWAFSISVTQFVKFVFPLEWPSKTRAMFTRFVAFVAALGGTYAYLMTPTGLLLGFMVGVWSPFAYWGVLAIVGHFFPWLKDAFSGDVRGVVFGDKRENRP